MDLNRLKKTKTVRTLIETNGERYEIQYEVGENEIDSIAQAQALQLFIDNYAATQSKTTLYQQQQAPPPLQVHEQMMPEEECILPDVPVQQAVAQYTTLQRGNVHHKQSVIEIDESDEERQDVKPDIKYVPPPPPADPDDLEAQISASVILVDEFKNAKMPANCSTNDSNSRSTRISKEDFHNIDSNDKSFSNAYKAFAVSCPDMMNQQTLFKQRFQEKRRRYGKNSREDLSSEPSTPTYASTIATPTPQLTAPVTQTMVSKSIKTTPVQSTVAVAGPLPKITTVWSAKMNVQSTNSNQPPVCAPGDSQPVAYAPQKVRRVVAPTPNITVSVSPPVLSSDPSNLLAIQNTKTLEQVEQEDEAANMQRLQRGRGRPVKRPIDPQPSSIKTSVITSVPKVEKPDVPVVTYQTVASPAAPVVAQTNQQTYTMSQPTAVVIDGQYYLLQAVPSETTPPSQTGVQQINQAIQPIVAQSLQPFLQQHNQQQPQQVYQHAQHATTEQPVQEVYRNAPIMIVNQPNFHISPNTPTTVPSATATTSSNNGGASQTIILTDEQYNNYTSQLHLLQQQQQQQPQQQSQPVPIQLHQNPMSYTNQQQTQVIVTPVRRGQKTTKNIVVGPEDLQFIEYHDLMNDVNSVSKKYY